jgi:hypothetical protein
MRATLIFSALLLAACQAPVVDAPSEDACGASALQHLVGAPVAAAEGVSAPGSVRIIRPNQAITMDYRTDRLNLDLDSRDRITRVYCM